MCTNCHYIWNPYAHKKVLVPCGKCPACMQEKACARSNRIRNNVTPGTIALFVTLTFTNEFVPYVKRSDLYSNDFEVNVYRNCSGRFIFDRHSKRLRFKKSIGVHPIDRCWIPLSDRLCSPANNIDVIKPLKGLKGLGSEYIGVSRYKDLQDFFKRLRVILKRHYNYEGEFSYFACSEYGGITYRPHFHILIFIGSSYEEIFRNAILEAWPFADKRRTAKYIEVAKDAASYVSSYVNSSASVLPLLSSDFFKQKHSASKNFGVVLDCFQLPSILQKIESGNLVYYRRQKFDGESSTVAVPIPYYVLNRYFPKFKGFSWLSAYQLRSVLLSPETIGDVFAECEYSFFASGKRVTCQRIPKLENPLYHYSPKESWRIYVMLENCYQRFHLETGLSRYDFALYYQRAWCVYNSTILRLSHEDIVMFEDYSDFYSNALDVFYSPDIAPTLSDLDLQLDPNFRVDVVSKSNHFRVLYDKLDKQKKVTNYCMSRCGHYV